MLTAFSIEYNKKPGKPAFVKAVKDPSVQRDDFYKSGKIHTGPGEAPSSQSRPTPPSKDNRPSRGMLTQEEDEEDEAKPPQPSGSYKPPTSQKSQKSATQANKPVPKINVQQPKATPQPLAVINGISKRPNQSPVRAVPTPPKPPTSIASGPNRDLIKVLYDFDGGKSEFPIKKGEILESLHEEQNGQLHPRVQNSFGFAH